MVVSCTPEAARSGNVSGGAEVWERFYTATVGMPFSLKSGCKTPPTFNILSRITEDVILGYRH